MRRGPPVADELRHLEHRLAVLRSFLDVDSDPEFFNALGTSRQGRIFRGCKDGAMVTCRALAERFGITIKTFQWKTLQPCTTEFRNKFSQLYPAATGDQIEALWDVLIAANRAVCHLEDTLIDHRVDSPKLRLATALIETLVMQELQKVGLTLTYRSRGGGG